MSTSLFLHCPISLLALENKEDRRGIISALRLLADLFHFVLLVHCYLRHFDKRQADLEILKNAGLLDKIDQIILRDTVNEIQKNQVLNNKYQPYFFAGASSALIKAWIEFGFTESPRDITDIFFASLSGYMSFE